MDKHFLSPLFSPDSIAVFAGTADDPSSQTSQAQVLHRMLRAQRYTGTLVFLDIHASGTLADLANTHADLAVIAMPPGEVASALEIAGRIKCRAALVISSGIDATLAAELHKATRTLVSYNLERIDPERDIDPEAEKVHGISRSQLHGKPKFADAEIAEAFLEERRRCPDQFKVGQFKVGPAADEPVGLADVGGQHAAPAQQVVEQLFGFLSVEKAVVRHIETQGGDQMIHQVLADFGRVVDDADTELGQLLLVADPRQHQKLGSVHRAGAQHNLTSGPHRLSLPPGVIELDPDRASALEDHPPHRRVGQQGQVRAMQHRFEVGVGAAPPPPRRLPPAARTASSPSRRPPASSLM